MSDRGPTLWIACGLIEHMPEHFERDASSEGGEQLRRIASELTDEQRSLLEQVARDSGSLAMVS